MTRTRRSSRSARAREASQKTDVICGLIALSLSGRFRVTVRTPSCTVVVACCASSTAALLAVFADPSHARAYHRSPWVLVSDAGAYGRSERRPRGAETTRSRRQHEAPGA